MSQLILVVDDEPGILTAMSSVLADEGYKALCTRSGEEAIEIYRSRSPDVVFLDIWLPDRDGLETLQALREIDPAAAVVMMSGHGTASTAVKAIKMGAFDYVEKPISYTQVLDLVAGALEHRTSLVADASLLDSLERMKVKVESRFDLAPPPAMRLMQESPRPQRTITSSTVVYGLGLHSGSRTGMAIQPLPANSGIHFVTLPDNVHIPAYVAEVAETDYATTLARNGSSIRTVEHLLSALHAYGITNLLIKVHGEIPVLDGSALEFCQTLEEVGVEDQERPRQEIVIDRRYEVGDGKEKTLVVEPFDGFAVSYLLRYPQPIGEQSLDFELETPARYKAEIAPCRTFGFMRDLKMMNELGLGSGGRLDNCILVGEDNVINTELRFRDEFVRHKILDIIGDLYLLGYPIRGRVTARFTGHRNNIALLREILERNS